jgi:sensor histidine kinase regulating citrate/malate metabolism
VVVGFADNGPGVPDNQKYLVNTLGNSYGGDVWVEDNDPKGAVFRIELPVAD